MLKRDSSLSAAVIRSILVGSRSERPSYCTVSSLQKSAVNLVTTTAKGLGKDNCSVALVQSKDIARPPAPQKQGLITEATHAQPWILPDRSIIFVDAPPLKSGAPRTCFPRTQYEIKTKRVFIEEELLSAHYR